MRAEVLGGAGAAASPRARAEGHRAADFYLCRMVATAWITIVRREGRQPQASSPMIERAQGSPCPEPEEQIDRAIGAVEVALDAVAVGRPELRATYREVWSLAMEDQTMAEGIARELGPDALPKVARTARDRLQQRHRRLRVLLVKALDDLEKRHLLDREDARLGRRFVEEVLNRAPKHRRS